MYIKFLISYLYPYILLTVHLLQGKSHWINLCELRFDQKVKSLPNYMFIRGLRAVWKEGLCDYSKLCFNLDFGFWQLWKYNNWDKMIIVPHSFPFLSSGALLLLLKSPNLTCKSVKSCNVTFVKWDVRHIKMSYLKSEIELALFLRWLSVHTLRYGVECGQAK